MSEHGFTPEQLRQLEERRQLLGEERIRQVEGEWQELMAEVRAAMDAGTDPASAQAQALARRWMALVHEFSGGDAGIEAKVGERYQREPEIHGMATAPIREMMGYITKALAAVRPAGGPPASS